MAKRRDQGGDFLCSAPITSSLLSYTSAAREHPAGGDEHGPAPQTWGAGAKPLLQRRKAFKSVGTVKHRNPIG